MYPEVILQEKEREREIISISSSAMFQDMRDRIQQGPGTGSGQVLYITLVIIPALTCVYLP